MSRLQTQILTAPSGVDVTSDPVAMPLLRGRLLYNLLIDRTAKLRATPRFINVLPANQLHVVDGVSWYYQAIIRNNQTTGLLLTDLLVWVTGGFLQIATPAADPLTATVGNVSIVGGGITGYTFSAQFFVGKRVRFASLLSELLMVQDGGLLPLRFYSTNTLGTGFYRAGIEPPTSSGAFPNLTLAASGTGLTGDYLYKLTFADERGRESSPTPGLAITLTNQGTQATWSTLYAAPPLAYSGSNLITANLYRNTLGAPSTFYQIASTPIPANTTSAVFPAASFFFNAASHAYDNATDVAIAAGTLAPNPGENDAPNAASIIAIHKNRVFLNDITDTTVLQVSNTLSSTQFTSIPASPEIATDGVRSSVGTDQGDPITALVEFGSVLGIFKRRGLFFLYGDDLTDFIIRPVHERGCIAPDTAVRCDNVIMYLCDDGVYAATYQGGDAVTKVSKEIEALLQTFTQAELEASLAWFVDNRYHLAVTGITFVYDFDAQGWTAYLQGQGCLPGSDGVGFLIGKGFTLCNGAPFPNTPPLPVPPPMPPIVMPPLTTVLTNPTCP